MVSVLIARLSSPGLSPTWGHYIVFLDKTLNSHSGSLSIQCTQVYKWGHVPTNLMLGITLRWT